MQPHHDAVLARQYNRLRRQGVRPHIWLETHFDLLALVAPAEDARRVRETEGNWECVAESIKRLIDSSATGASVFSFCQTLVSAAQFADLVAGLLPAVRAANFSPEALKQFKQQAQLHTDKMQASPLLFQVSSIFVTAKVSKLSELR